MAFSEGHRLGPYEIILLIGEGGMGEVYKARDTRLDRIVALKVSKAEFSERFDREARAVAALNHPNICALHDVGPNYLVMEYVDGVTLADRMARGAMSLDEALPIARQIAEAIEAAHEKGIIHRDLKPENVKLTADGGVVKVLDFGLAKAVEIAQDPSGATTIKASASLAGMIVGTPAYMSPEQAAGKQVDKRTDIWSYGVILWEMVTGRRMFEGETVSHIMAAVLTQQPDITAMPHPLRSLAERTLVKDSRRRMRDIGEARLMLDGDITTSAVVTGEDRTVKPGKIPWIITTAALLVSALTAAALWRAAPPVERPLMRLEVDLGHEVQFGASSWPDVIISPDGRRLVFATQSRLYTRLLDQSTATALNGTDLAFGAFFSPDGKWVAFFADGKLKKISVEGGGPVVLCEAPNPRGGAWGENDTIIAALTSSGGVLSKISAGGGNPERITELRSGEATHRWPQILPGGKAVLFTSSASVTAFDRANVEVRSLRDRSRKLVQRGATFGRYIPSSTDSRQKGHLIYLNRSTLFAAPFDSESFDVSGSGVPVLNEVSFSPVYGFGHLAFSDTGTFVYRSGGGRGSETTLNWLDSSGALKRLPAKPGPYLQPRLSPDGQRVALRVEGASTSEIHVYDWRRDVMSRLTFGDKGYSLPVWSPDGQYLVFAGDSGMYWTRADGSDTPQPLMQSAAGHYPWSFSRDGRRLAYAESGGSSGLDLWTAPVSHDAGRLEAGKPELFQRSSASETYPAFSPDGRWIAYRSVEGTSEIYVRSFPNKGGRWQISTGNANLAVWSPNGRELFYRTQDQQIMVVSYSVKGDSFIPDKPRVWSDTRLADTGFIRNADLTPDGKRFLVLMPAEPTGQQTANSRVTFLLNFSDELRRRGL